MTRAAYALVVAILAAGCSFSFVDRYREPPPGAPPPGCTTSYRWPVADAVLAAAAATAVVYVVATRDADDETPDTSRGAVAGFGSLFGLVTGASAIYGALAVGTCRDEKTRWH